MVQYLSCILLRQVKTRLLIFSKYSIPSIFYLNKECMYCHIFRFKMRNNLWFERKGVFVLEIKTTQIKFLLHKHLKRLFNVNIITRLFYKPLGHFCQKSSKHWFYRKPKMMKMVIAHLLSRSLIFNSFCCLWYQVVNKEAHSFFKKVALFRNSKYISP